jgi:hAT family C-terminal dimerisation region
MTRTTAADLEVEDPLAWWICHSADYPVLSKIGIDHFSCPAMSSEFERVFSETKRVIPDERNRLNSDTVVFALTSNLCLGKWPLTSSLDLDKQVVS